MKERTEEGDDVLDTVQNRHMRHREKGTEAKADKEEDAPHLVLALVEPRFLRRQRRQF